MERINIPLGLFLPRCMECRRDLAMRILSVCLSVRPSVKRVYCDKTKEKSVQIFIPHERAFIIIVFWKKRMNGGATPSTWNFGSNWQRWSKLAYIPYIFVRSASAVTSSEKSSIITNRKSTTGFLMSPRWTSYIVPKPPKGGPKTQSVPNLNNKLRYLRNRTR